MAGEAKTTSFMLASATLMIGPQASMWDFTPANNSIGLVKGVEVSTNPSYVELTQGPKGQVVYSSMVANPVSVKAQVYEYTAANLAYGLGLEGYNLVSPTVTNATLTAGLTGNTSTPVTTLTMSAPTDLTASLTAGAWISIQGQDKALDRLHVAQLSANATVTGTGPYVHTLTFAGFGLKTGNNFSAGDKVLIMSPLDVGVKSDSPFHAAKIVANLPDTKQPVAIYIPKCRVTKGFQLGFTTDNFGNMPFELQCYDQVPADPWYSSFNGVAKIMSAA